VHSLYRCTLLYLCTLNRRLYLCTLLYVCIITILIACCAYALYYTYVRSVADAKASGFVRCAVFDALGASSSGGMYELNVACGGRGRYVVLVLPGAGRTLSLSEVSPRGGAEALYPQSRLTIEYAGWGAPSGGPSCGVCGVGCELEECSATFDVTKQARAACGGAFFCDLASHSQLQKDDPCKSAGKYWAVTYRCVPEVLSLIAPPPSPPPPELPPQPPPPPWLVDSETCDISGHAVGMSLQLIKEESQLTLWLPRLVSVPGEPIAQSFQHLLCVAASAAQLQVRPFVEQLTSSQFLHQIGDLGTSCSPAAAHSVADCAVGTLLFSSRCLVGYKLAHYLLLTTSTYYLGAYSRLQPFPLKEYGTHYIGCM
jgi:hypothetical protein